MFGYLIVEELLVLQMSLLRLKSNHFHFHTDFAVSCCGTSALPMETIPAMYAFGPQEK